MNVHTMQNGRNIDGNTHQYLKLSQKKKTKNYCTAY